MTTSLLAALICTAALIMVSLYFILGSAPLLVLKHDIPLDASFIRGFFNTYYRLAMVAAGATAVGYTFAGRFDFAAGAVALVLCAFVLRQVMVPKMDALGAGIQAGEENAIGRFRRLHVIAILLIVAQLAVIIWALITLSKEVTPPRPGTPAAATPNR